jgi:urease accessory protein
MTSDTAGILAALQFGDSAFPAGGFAFSWGLEGLAADGLVATAVDVAEVIEEQLVHRWNSMDRILLKGAYEAAGLDAVIALDHLAEAATASAPMRSGSRRAGRALLGVFARLGHERAATYRLAADADQRLGHLAVAQGLVFKEAGLPASIAELLGGWTMVTGLAGAAIRLGLLGHLDAQAILTDLRRTLERLLSTDVPACPAIASFTPLLDIAVSRHPHRHVRMFAT